MMIKCKQWEQAPCGKEICCFCCPEFDECKFRCEEYEGLEEKVAECENAIECNEVVSLENLVGEAITTVVSIASEKKRLDELDKKMKAQIQKAMEENDIKSFENEDVKITYVPKSSSLRFDSKSLQKDEPSIYERYLVSSSRSAYVKITEKKK